MRVAYKDIIDRIAKEYPGGVKNPLLTNEEFDIIEMNAAEGLLNMGVTDRPKLITIIVNGSKITIETKKYKP
jgi:hypothetical protein